eukprot:scaffold27070_cov63-Phaeocystis_antarctica.AAC.6
MSCRAATVSSSAISASTASSASSTRSGPERAAGARRAGATNAARTRFTPMLSANHSRPASNQAGCGARCSAMCCAVLGHVLGPLAVLDGGPGGIEVSRNFVEAIEPSEFLDLVCTLCTWWTISCRSKCARSRERTALARSVKMRLW